MWAAHRGGEPATRACVGQEPCGCLEPPCNVPGHLLRTQRGESSPKVPQALCLDGLRQVLLGVLLQWGRVCRDPSVLQDRLSPLGMGRSPISHLNPVHLTAKQLGQIWRETRLSERCSTPQCHHQDLSH